ncbi:hypothetical protein PAXRUDRAFT_22752, partial [Paxillus rubicundulus Ve08.2h10]
MAVDEDIEAVLQQSSSLPPMTPSPMQGSSALPPVSADDPKNDEEEESNESDGGNVPGKLAKLKKSKNPPSDSGDELPPLNMKRFPKGFSEFDVAQHLFKKEVDKYDKKKGRDALKCSTIGERTKN